MAKLELFGSYVALITPFTADDQVEYTFLLEYALLLLVMTAVFGFNISQVDYACIEDLVEWHVQEGTAGIVPCGTTGESPTLSEEVR